MEADQDMGAAIRRLVRGLDRAALATLSAGEWPHASLVLTGCGLDGAPLLLISRLAEHTRNLARNDRASLLFDATGGLDSPLTGSRASLVGHLRPVADDSLRARYVARHPDSAAYAGFGDFGLYRMDLVRAHLVAGFGRITWVDGAEILLPGKALAGFDEAALLADPELQPARSDENAGQDGTRWAITGIDPDGCDLRAGGRVARRDFDSPALSTPQARSAARNALHHLTQR